MIGTYVLIMYLFGTCLAGLMFWIYEGREIHVSDRHLTPLAIVVLLVGSWISVLYLGLKWVTHEV